MRDNQKEKNIYTGPLSGILFMVFLLIGFNHLYVELSVSPI